jgi:hypothetical protein
MAMNKNVGGVDRTIRIVVGVILVALSASAVIGPWGYFGLIVLATGAFKYCALYSMVGLNTCAPKATEL